MKQEEVVSEPTPPAPEPVQAEPPKAEPPKPAAAAIAASAAPQSTATPSPRLASRPAAGRGPSRHKLTDQPVVMPSSFGSIEKVGMQFGSLSLGGESLNDGPYAFPPTFMSAFTSKLTLC